MRVVYFVWIAGLRLVIGLVACGVTARQAVDGALSVEQLACVLMQAELGASEPDAVSAVCAIPMGLLKEIEDVLLARAKGHAMALEKKPEARCPVKQP